MSTRGTPPMLADVAAHGKPRRARLIRTTSPRYLGDVHRLIAYLRDNVVVDFQGDLSLEKLKELVGDDDSRDARALVTRLTRDKGVDQMLLAVADGLVAHVQGALDDATVHEQLRSYIDS